MSFTLNSLGQKMVYKEFLGKPTQKSIAIKVFFDISVEISVQYGLISGKYTLESPWQTFKAMEPGEISLTNLNANTTYYYRIQYRLPNSSAISYRPEYKFQTQRAVNSSFTFVVQSDPHLDEQSDSALFRLCLKNQLADKPDFMLDLGDILMTDKLKNAAGAVPKDTITYRSQLFRNYYETIAHSVPIFISMGNHEGESGWNLNNTANNIAVWGTLERKKYFMNPAPNDFYTGDQTVHPFVGLRENYYEFTWGDAQFIILDPYWYTTTKPDANNGWRWTLGKTQYDWLRNSLEKSKSKFKFIFAHQLIGGDPNGRGGIEFADLYEWGGKNLNGTDGWATNRPGWYKPIKDLLTENRVTVFFHGHDHFYAKQDKDCLVYQETPQPSHPVFLTANSATQYGYIKGEIYPNAGHIRVNVSGEGVKVDYVRAYLPKNETATRKNMDVSASYFIGAKNCYDDKPSNVVLWNANYINEVVYPNPLRQKTTLSFNLSKPDLINLSIFNSAGLEVKQLLRENPVQDGNYQVIWDGTDVSNRPLPPGQYIYQFTGPQTSTKTGKIILID
jgi:predicted phosphodiesterase